MEDHIGSCIDFTGEFASGNIFIRPVNFSKLGDVVGGHVHNFDHTTIFFKGEFDVHIVDPATQEVVDKHMIAPDFMLIKANLEHTITSTSEGSSLMWCVYSHRNAQGEVVQEVNNLLVNYG